MCTRGHDNAQCLEVMCKASEEAKATKAKATVPAAQLENYGRGVIRLLRDMERRTSSAEVYGVIPSEVCDAILGLTEDIRCAIYAVTAAELYKDVEE